jgi:hypothetical protein
MITRFSDFDYKNSQAKPKETIPAVENIDEKKKHSEKEEKVEEIKESSLRDIIYPEAKKPFLVPDIEEDEEKTIEDFIDPAFLRKEPVFQPAPVQEAPKEIELEEIIETPQIQMDPMAYKIFRDKAESFECKVMIEGSNVQNTAVRLLLESEEWNIFFKGSISNGICRIPLKKIGILSPGLKGVIKLEVIVDGEIFYPWYETFQVQNSKNVKVEILSQKQNNEVQSGTRVSIA